MTVCLYHNSTLCFLLLLTPLYQYDLPNISVVALDVFSSSSVVFPVSVSFVAAASNKHCSFPSQAAICSSVNVKSSKNKGWKSSES